MIYGFVCLPQREISQSCSQSEAIFSSSSQKKEALDNFLSRHPKGHSYQFLRFSHLSPVGKQKKHHHDGQQSPPPAAGGAQASSPQPSQINGNTSESTGPTTGGSRMSPEGPPRAFWK